MSAQSKHCPECGLFSPCKTCSRVRLGVVTGLVDTAVTAIDDRADRAIIALRALINAHGHAANGAPGYTCSSTDLAAACDVLSSLAEVVS